MATKYADRAFLSVNGVKIADLQSGSVRQDRRAKAVDTMTPDRFNRGFTEGNTLIDIAATIAVRNSEPRPKLDQIDYAANDIQITWVCGSEQFTATGVFLKDTQDNAAGVGQEVQTSFNFGATKLLDSVGNPASFNLILA